MNNNLAFQALPDDIAVLCGGPGAEREVSLASGREVHAALTGAGLENRLLIVPEKNADDFLERLDCGLAVMMLHGRFGEGGTAQRILERRGIAYSGSAPEACRLSMDKAAAKTLLREAGCPTPDWAVADSAEAAEEAVRAAGLRYPLFVKPNFGGSSVGVSRVDSPLALKAAVSMALACGGPAVIEELVLGREMTAGWLDGRLLPLVEIETDRLFYDYHSKYESESTRYHCPADVEGAMRARVEEVVSKAVELMGARDLAAVDFILTEDGPMLLELNSLPGFTGRSLLPMAASSAGIGKERLSLSLAAMAAERAIPNLHILPPGGSGDEEEDTSEIIDFHCIDWKRVGV